MTTALTDKNSTTLRKDDDLTSIKGISPERQRKLKKFGILTLQDLAEVSDDKIEAIAAEIKGVSVKMIKRWRTEARERLPSQQAIKPPKLEGETANSSTTKVEWKSTDVFIVQFQVLEMEGRKKKHQVIAEHIEVRDGTWMDKVTGETQVITDGELCRWVKKELSDRMRRMSELENEPLMEIQSTAATPTAGPPAEVQITQVRIFQPPRTETPIATGKVGQLFQGFVKSEEPFALEASFKSAELGAAAIAKRQTYNAQFHVRNQTTGEKTVLGCIEDIPLEAREVPYTATLPRASLLSGVYRLRVLVTLQSLPSSVGYLEVPMLQVV